jgi:transposase-like protein
MRRPYTTRQRSELVDLVTTGQATVAEAAARTGVAPSTAYHWMKRAGAVVRGLPAPASPVSRARRLAEPTFVRLVPASAVHAAITVMVDGAEIQVQRDFDRDLLRAVVEALRGDAP